MSEGSGEPSNNVAHTLQSTWLTYLTVYLTVYADSYQWWHLPHGPISSQEVMTWTVDANVGDSRVHFAAGRISRLSLSQKSLLTSYDLPTLGTCVNSRLISRKLRLHDKNCTPSYLGMPVDSEHSCSTVLGYVFTWCRTVNGNENLCVTSNLAL